jgi:AtzE family amidohydrolase
VSDDALAIASAVRAGRVRARDVAAAALDRIGKHDGAINSFTAVTAEAALRDAQRIDAAVAAGMDPGPLAGAPFAVKNLFDVAGMVTLAGSRINADRRPAVRDAVIVAALRRAGAVLVGALNMDEYAYGFTTENSHYGPTRNPHDPLRVAGGSSGGSGAAVAAGLVPIALGSDTNGSIRVPSALCGVFGLKPTYGRVSRTGAALFSTSLDHVGPLARSLRDTAVAYDVIQGPDPEDPVSSSRNPEPCLPRIDEGIAGIRIAVAGGHFARGGEPETFGGVEAAAAALGVTRRVEIPEAHRARAAAMTITAAEGAHLHAADLRSRAGDFDPRTRGRFLAGALIPAALYLEAQRFRAWYRDQVRALFREVDVILAPTTPWAATRIGEDTITVGGEKIPIRPSFGLYTQPISFIGLPVLAAPIARPGSLPRGIQIIGAPFTETLLFRVAAALEAMGVVGAILAEVPTVQA